MNVLKFTLSGKTAFFKKPDVNSYFYFTYGHIHKIALLGIFGAIMGYGGYNQQVRNGNAVYPEFYEKLREIKISIVPKEAVNEAYQPAVPRRNDRQKGYFNKKVQIFNNTVGYANADGNLIVKEQWLENPCWDIYLILQGEVEEEIAKRIINSRATYIPYLGKNDHPAKISHAEIVEMELISLDQSFCMDSLYLKDCFKICLEDDDKLFDMDEDIEITFKYEERLPVELEEATNQYITAPFAYTNSKVMFNQSETAKKTIVGCCQGKCLQFY
ncbi:type I-B CRISPR-associated protein Cas5b [Clostridium aminobutyricum]|uniref:Type I-B CRISPR-associated protein Cas5 n=1 Tax=Clostridium aminobutyricum TaxID=33953 RepID=A0A939IFT6_CLOAM|nr:type I-B CRISPR-associated protein Cas5b [Clostridium aminobutyricum]MBN7771880.1 type I-B CRISPR-associated protein Cas5 [Clostridium aminobutyricum]